MIERYFSQAKLLIRLRTGPIGPYLPRFVSALEQRCFSQDSIRRFIRGADSLCRWLDAQGVTLVEANQNDIERYVHQHPRLPDIHYKQGRLPKAASSVRIIAMVLSEQGILCGSAPISKTDAWLIRFDNHLMRVDGISRDSRRAYVRYARRMIQSLEISEPDWTVLNAKRICDFVCCQAARLKAGSCQLLVAAIRALLRFLAAEGAIVPNLDRAIPAIREWRHAPLPQYISTEQLERVVEICRTPTASCLRDACMVLMMARLGMRAGEVRQLKLDDIDWVEGVIHVRAGKSRRERTLPLLEEIGDALGVYLRQERPQSAERSIFLTLLPPYRPLAWSTAISQITKRILKKAVGFPLGARERLLRDFVAFIEDNGIRGAISAQIALDWACSASDRCGISGRAARLSLARRFLFHLSAVVPGTEVPGARLLGQPPRRKPFLFSADEMGRLLKAALSLGPRASLRPHTLSTLLGLLASSGLRASEALNLTVRDVLLDLDPPRLQIRKAKFHKSRLVPIHQTVGTKLRQYAELRHYLNYDGLSDSFFVSEQGSPVRYKALNDAFQKLVRGLGIEARDGSRRPSLHSLRHGFAVNRLRTWYQQGIDVMAHLPQLSVYLGHLEPAQTYWYLTATPELLSEAARSFATYAMAGGEP